LTRGGRGIGLVAIRNIRKGQMIFNDSLEYMFTQVAQEGDLILFNQYKQASKQTKPTVPSTFPHTPEVLF
jgi:hypothetical protein